MSTHEFAPLKNDLLLRAARGEKVERPPMWVMRQGKPLDISAPDVPLLAPFPSPTAGRYLPEYHQAKGNCDFFAVCRDPETASTITLQPVERYAGLLDAAIIFSDILVIPQAMGMTVEMIDKKGPHFPNPLRDPNSPEFEQVVTKEVDVKKELGYVFEAITLTRKKLEGRVPLIGFVGAPWTLMSYMIEGGGSKMFNFVKGWIFKHPEESKRLLQRVAEVCVDFLVEQVVAGAQLTQVFDSWAGELSPHDFAIFSLPYLKYISHNLPIRLKALGIEPVPMTVFAKGAWYALDTLCESGYQTIGLDWTYDPAEACKVANGRVTLQGNMDPNVLYGGRKAITENVERMLEGFKGAKGRYIINLGHGITPFVDPEDLKHFFEECHRVGNTLYSS